MKWNTQCKYSLNTLYADLWTNIEFVCWPSCHGYSWQQCILVVISSVDCCMFIGLQLLAIVCLWITLQSRHTVNRKIEHTPKGEWFVLLFLEEIFNLWNVCKCGLIIRFSDSLNVHLDLCQRFHISFGLNQWCSSPWAHMRPAALLLIGQENKKNPPVFHCLDAMRKTARAM